MPETNVTSPVISTSSVASTAKMMGDIVRLIVDRPSQVEVDTRIEDQRAVLLLAVAPEDMDILIGRQGRTVQSLRVVLASISRSVGLSFSLEIQPEGR
jgi:uncharacterized protein